MLVLSRKNQERIVIGQDIEVTVLSIQGNRVQLGICAPVEVPIVRKELEGRTKVSPPQKMLGTSQPACHTAGA